MAVLWIFHAILCVYIQIYCLFLITSIQIDSCYVFILLPIFGIYTPVIFFIWAFSPQAAVGLSGVIIRLRRTLCAPTIPNATSRGVPPCTPLDYKFVTQTCFCFTPRPSMDVLNWLPCQTVNTSFLQKQKTSLLLGTSGIHAHDCSKFAVT